MGRKARNPEPWTFEDLAGVVDGAGLHSVDSMAERMGKDTEQVDAAAFLLGLDVELACPDLLWCDRCATWRTHLDASGTCLICSLRKRLAGRERAVAEALALLPPEQRELYAEMESLRGRRVERMPPLLTVPANATRREREALAAFQAQATEQWEIDRLTKDYNAAKTRLRRIREKSGTNPRKGDVRSRNNDERQGGNDDDRSHTDDSRCPVEP